MFYSSTIFSNIGLEPSTITLLVGIVNFATTFVGLGLLTYFGRKTIMFFCNIAMAGILIGLGVCIQENEDEIAVALLLAFISFFEFSSGPITWLYMAEIM